MDDLDRAKELEMAQRQQAVNAVRNQPQAAQQRGDDGTVICIDCGDVIPQARLMAKPDAARCIGCKQALETKQKHLSGHPALPRYQVIHGQDNRKK